MLHYQFPLKAKQADKGIGKVDLLGATDRGHPIVIELKVKPEKRSGGADARGDTPLRALMEGLRYAAIVEANLDVLAREAKSRFSVETVKEPPLRRCSRQELGGIAGRRVWLAPPAAPPGFGRRRSPNSSRISRRVLASPVSSWRLDDIEAGAIGYGANMRRLRAT